MRFKDKVCIVTGATSGIGRATAERMGEEGGKVLVVGRDEERGKEVVDTIKGKGGDAQFADVDVADAKAVEAAVRQALDTWGRVDVMVNNAAMMTFTPIVDLAVEDWDQVLAVNLRAVFLFCKFTIPHMNGGAIVNVSSVHAFQSTANVIPYASSKGGMEAFSRGVALEYDMAKVRINCVAPGAIDTPMLWENPNVKSGEEKIEGAIGQPADIASAICYLASDEARYINGTTLVVDGGRLGIL
ncbi:SDR family NAD(P)-dependent oxidoreductase [Spirosoma utsteinense]|uniref:NAD(P)-dependent dehydrogenase (Short-subunit alcohol dehydrogenase family) n=1 Tax=Spirosoma utsteinense TaxID=2585773 RepID=A0ABR6W207_9BACT|nr:SDR family oxidoreductase [Spirosoma utsteinense]MBC3784490.1 NAD(P)-dependent dehydrogenase (short-subunit alcohol dehydrogenase family) [Spirosoma utsteinense]MBC3789760.1 NAD(P)-dependent dehydrogenase (short-subunit alcohol dehydrogenase family) [Spirosoma utsteinense]